MRSVADYMRQQLIPNRIVDLMMSRPSNDIYWLTRSDLDELGEYDPVLEEHLIRRCGYIKSPEVKALSLAEQGRGGDAAELIARADQASPCISEEINAMQEAGHAAIKAGWTP